MTRLLILSALAGCLPPGLFATTCIWVPPCQVLRPTSVLFVGTALDSVPDPSDRDGVVVRFKVEERLAGVASGVEELTVGVGSPSTQQGVRYLVDAHRLKNGSLVASICGVSGEVDSKPTKEVIEYVRRQLAGTAKTTLTVRVRDRSKALPGAAVSISGPGGAVVRTADSDGRVVLEGIAPGQYQFSARLEHYREDPSEAQSDPITVLAGGCANATVLMLPQGKVSGVLRHFDGKSAARVRLDLVEVEQPTQRGGSPSSRATTDAEGRFVFSDVSPGTYLLGANIDRWSATTVPRTWYPSSREKAGAFPIQVEAGRPVENLTMVLPDFGPVRKVRVCMVDQQGKPIPGAMVLPRPTSAKDEGSVALDGFPKADASGCVLLTGYSKIAYRIGAGHASPQASIETALFSDTVTIPPGEGPVERVLVLKAQTVR